MGRLGVTSLTRPDTSEHGEAPADGTECARLANARRRRVRQKATKAFYRQTVTEGADGGSAIGGPNPASARGTRGSARA